MESRNNEMIIAKALETIITERGKEVLKSSNMVQSMIMDYIGNGCDNEKKLFKISCQHGILNYAYDILCINNNEQKRLLANKAKKWLETEAFLSEENAVIAVNIILEAVHTDFWLENENKKYFEGNNDASNLKIYNVEKSDVEFNPMSENVEEWFKKGEAYYYGDEKNIVEAVKCYKKLAEQGYDKAQYMYGRCLLHGVGIERNEKEAVEWYKKAAEQKCVQAQADYGWCLHNGIGVEEDKEEGVEWYEKSAKQGYAWGQYNYGWCLLHGAGIKKNEKEAVEWYKKAAEQKCVQAQVDYGWCLHNGIGVEEDKEKGVEWYEKSAEQGYAWGQYNYAWCLLHGVGIKQDEENAIKWFEKASQQGNDEAKKALKNLYITTEIKL